MSRNYGTTFVCPEHPKKTARAKRWDAGTTRNPHCPVCGAQMNPTYSSAKLQAWVERHKPYKTREQKRGRA